ncbi:MAG: hypothetical protein ACRDBG_22685 [Waterburya sp.]
MRKKKGKAEVTETQLEIKEIKTLIEFKKQQGLLDPNCTPEVETFFDYFDNLNIGKAFLWQ